MLLLLLSGTLLRGCDVKAKTMKAVHIPGHAFRRSENARSGVRGLDEFTAGGPMIPDDRHAVREVDPGRFLRRRNFLKGANDWASRELTRGPRNPNAGEF
jgi:hypothetical protein